VAKKIRRPAKCEEDLGLNVEEVSFYDAFAKNESVMRKMDDNKFKIIAAELMF
jgi:hypothetical protein